MMIWVTGLSGVGKTSLCRTLFKRLKGRMPELVILDGDAVRELFGNDLDYNEEDRVTQIKRIQRLARALLNQDLSVLVAALYSHPELLAWNRANLPCYYEIYLRAPMDDLQRRDSKGLYADAVEGLTKFVVGVDIPWHEPKNADLVIDVDFHEKPEIQAARVERSVPWLPEVDGGV